MGLSESEVIILRTYKLAEADKIAVFLSRDRGVMRGVARGARRLRSRFGAALEPFTLSTLSYFEKEGQEIVSIRQAEILCSYFELSKDAEIISALEYLGGLVLEFSPPHEPNEKVFRMLKVCLEAVALAPDTIQQILRYCEVWLLKLSGFLPDFRACSVCNMSFQATTNGSYLGFDGALRCNTCSSTTDMFLLSDTGALLRASQRLNPSEWAHSIGTSSERSFKQLSQVSERLITRALERLPRGRITVE